MKKITLLSVLVSLIFLLSNPAYSFDFKLDFSALTAADQTTLGGFAGETLLFDPDGVTGLFNAFGLAGASLINQNDNDVNGIDIGDTFSESFIAYVDGFQPGMADTEGLNVPGIGFELTVVTSGLSGVVTTIGPGPGPSDVTVGYEFTPGSTINLYLDAGPDFPQDPYSEITLADGTNPSSIDTSNYTDGVLIASAILRSGVGSTLVVPTGGESPDGDQGSVNLTYEFTYFYDNMFLDSLGVDFNDYPAFYAFFGLPAMDVDNTVTSVAQNITGSLFDAKVQNDGSAPIQPIPEPGTILLLGFGLIGFASVSRRKMFK